MDPHPLLVDSAGKLPPGRALDLACGTGRNALWLAQHGWSVTAVDVSPTAIETVLHRAAQLGVHVDAKVADLENSEFTVEPGHWDLIVMCYYLQRDLFAPCKGGLTPGGVIVAITLLIEPGKENSPFRLQPGELRDYFDDCEILHYREWRDQSGHAVAEIVARRASVKLGP